MISLWWTPVLAPTQDYGCTDFSYEGHNPNHPECEWFHEGIDFPLPCGTPIRAGRDVMVTACDPPGYGPPGDTAAICLWDKTTNRDIWLYHMASYQVLVFQYVKAGDLIGFSGTRGYSTGCHTHFEVRPHGAPYRSSVNPTEFITGDVMDNRQYYNILEAVSGYRLNDDGSPTLDAKGNKIPTPFAAQITAQIASLKPVPGAVDTAKILTAIADLQAHPAVVADPTLTAKVDALGKHLGVGTA